MINKLFSLGLFLLLPLVAVAQQVDYTEPIAILMMYSLGSAVLVGVVTSTIVLVNGRRMKGGVFGDALTYFGVGMFIILVGSVFMLVPAIMPDSLKDSLPSILNTIGYVIIAIAGNKLLKVTKSDTNE